MHGSMEVQDILNLNFYRFYKEIVIPAGKNLTLPEILDFYDFCKAVEDLSSISDFYEFYVKVVTIDKDIDISQLFDDYRQAIKLANEGHYNKAVKVFKSRKLKKIWKAHHPNAHQPAPAKTRQIFFDIAVITLISIVVATAFYFLDSFWGAKMLIGITYLCTTYILWFGLTVFFGTVFFVIMKNTVWPRFCRWCKAKKQERRNRRAVKSLQPNLHECIKHYVRVIKKTPKPTEDIYEIKNNGEQLKPPIPYEGKEYDYTRIEQKEDGKFSLTLITGKKKNCFRKLVDWCLRKKDADTPLTLQQDESKDDGSIQLIYVYIKVYVKKKG